MFKNPLQLLAISCAFLLAGGCSGAAGTTEAGSAGRSAVSVDPRRVTTAVAVELPLERLLVVTGTLAAEQEIVLGMKVSGRISALTVDLGSAVKKGDIIARLDDTDFQLRVRQAEAALQQARVRLGLPRDGSGEDVDLEQTAPVREARAQMDGARARLDRATQLWEKGLLAKSDLDATSSAYKVTEAQYADSLDEASNRLAVLAQRRSELEIARQQLADAVLYSPIDGMIRSRSASIGQYLIAGTPVVTLVQIHPLRLRTDLPEREALNVRIGMPVRLTIEGAEGFHEGRIARLSPSFDETNRTLLVETEIANTRGQLRPGAFARAEIVTSSNQRALVVPHASLVTFAGIDRVFVVENGTAVEKRLKTGRRTEAGVEVLEGIASGAAVILNPGNLTNGESVSATPEAAR
jgi:RND family efflux transporter MFP subunit